MSQLIFKKLRIFLIIFCSFYFFGCLQVYNSSSGDRARYGTPSVDSTTPSGQNFSAAYTVLSQRCFQCHSYMSNYTTQQNWIDSGKVVPRSLATSVLYYRINGSGLGKPPTEPENMPQNGILTASELAAIKTWIEQM
jgi:hypothetical protein